LAQEGLRLDGDDVEVALSVIIPCRNGARYLGAAIESVLAQPLDEVEIVVVNDGSVDDSAAVARGCGPRVRVIDLPPSGLPAARQRGINEARAQTLAFCDADDLWAADRLPGQLEFMRRESSGVCLGFSKSFLSPELKWAWDASAEGEANYWRTFGALLIDRKVLESAGTLPQNGSDIHIPLFAALQDKGVPVARYNKVVSFRRVHLDNDSRRNGPRFGDYARSIKGVLDRRRQDAAKAQEEADSASTTAIIHPRF